MKIEKRKIMVPKDVIVYIASDGTEFETDTACLNYEQRLKEASNLSVIEQCDALEGYPPPAGGDYNESHTFKWYRPKTVEEMDILRSIYTDHSFSDKNIGKWHCIEENGDFDSWVTEEDSITEYIIQVYEKLGYTVNFIDNNKGYSIERLKVLLDEVTTLSVLAPGSDETTYKEEELLEEIANLRMVLEDYLEA